MPETLFFATLGWAPRTTLDEGLARTIAYFDALLAGGQPLVDLSRRAPAR